MHEALAQWPFVIAAYAITLASVVVLVLASWLGCRRAERQARDARDTREDGEPR